MVLTFIFGFLMWRFVEQPFRKPLFFTQNPKWKYVLLSTFFMLIGLGIHANKTGGWEWRLGEPIVNIEEVEDARTFHRTFYGGASYPSYGSVNTSTPPDLIVLGDSHGRHYAEGLYKVIAEPNDYSFFVTAGTSCFHLPHFTRTTEGHDWDANCPRRLNQALEFIRSASKPPLVVISHSWNSQMSRADLLDENGNRRNHTVDVNDLIEGILHLTQEIGNSKLVVIGNVPRAGTNLYDVFTRPRPLFFDGFDPESYLFRERDPRLEETNSALRQAAEETGAFTFVDPFDFLCDAERCRNIDDQRRLIYSDGGHLSRYGSIYLIERIESQILELMDQR